MIQVMKATALKTVEEVAGQDLRCSDEVVSTGAIETVKHDLSGIDEVVETRTIETCVVPVKWCRPGPS